MTAEDYQDPVGVVQFVLDARKPRAHAALVDEDCFGLVHVDDGQDHEQRASSVQTCRTLLRI